MIMNKTLLCILAFCFCNILTSFGQEAPAPPPPENDTKVNNSGELNDPFKSERKQAEMTGIDSLLMWIENYGKEEKKPEPVKEEKKTETNDVSTYLLEFENFDFTNKVPNNGKTLTTVTIGSQIWMGQNLDVTIFSNGDPIAEAKTDKEWLDAFEAKRPAWCYYNNDPANGAKYGKLYNWYAVFDPRGLAPDGWKIPTKKDWLSLNIGFNGSSGQKMKSKTGWKESTSYNNGTDELSFTALPGGWRLPSPGSFEGLGSSAYWWTTTKSIMLGYEMGNGFRLDYNDSEIREMVPENEGLSVRCIKQ